MHVVTFTGLDALVRALAGFEDHELVIAVPPGTAVDDGAAARAAYDDLDGMVVLAAASESRVDARVAAAHPTVSTPYRYVAGDALAGPAGALRDLASRALATGLDGAAALSERYLAGDDVELDVGAELFLVLDGTGTDALVLSGRSYATATGTFPAVVVGDRDAVVRDDERADLVRVLGYEGAIADDAPKVQVGAPELLVLPFWRPEFCASVVRAAEATGAWASDDDDPVPGFEVPLTTISPRLFEHVEQHIAEVVVPALREQWPEFAWNGVHDAFVIKYVAGGAVASLPLHHDVAQISASVRLNDGYAGGALEFPRQQWDNRDLTVGELVAWPSLVTHPHGGLPVERGVKYGLTIWFALPG